MKTLTPPWTHRAILTWVCQHCGWANDNNNTGPCRNCKAETQPGERGSRAPRRRSPTRKGRP